jgi:rhodanese-related sulfurtransferase
MKIKIMIGLLAVLYLSLSGFACKNADGLSTGPSLTPPSSEQLAEQGFVHPEMPRITCEKLKQMIDTGDNPVLIDTRPPASFKLQHIPGAINIPYNTESPLTDAGITSTLLELPGDKLLVFYCDCSDDVQSAGLADKLIKLDAKYATADIKILWKGYWNWVALGYPVLQ